MIATQYSPPSELIIHDANGLLNSRESTPSVVHMMQYDNNYPIIAVHLLANYQPYTIPEGVSVNVRMRKPDGKNVYNPAIGISNDRQTVYIGVTFQMTAAYGRGIANVEIMQADRMIGTAAIIIDIDQNPIQGEAIESTDEYKSLVELVNEINEAASMAKDSAEKAKESETNAANSAEAAKNAAIEAGESAERSEESERNSEFYANASKGYAESAKQYTGKPPIIINNTWWVWDAESQAYVDTTIKASILIDENSGNEVRMWFGTVAEYNALPTIDPDIYYNILEGEP